jgi:hypothetical protein
MPVYCAARYTRGAARAGVLATLFALIGLLIGLPAPKADGPREVRQRAVREPEVAPHFTNVRDLIRRTGAIHEPRRLKHQIPIGRWTPPGQTSSAPAPPSFFAQAEAPVSQAPSPRVIRSFDTIPDTPGGEPPDNGLAVGPTQVVSAANSSWGIYDKETGRQLFLIPFTDWYGSLDSTGFIFDPRVDYDIVTGRYYLVTISLDPGAEVANLQISVSQTSDALGSWAKYNFSVKETSPVSSWMDFPMVGYNDLALFVTGNVFGFNAGFQHTTYRAFDKAKLLAGQPVSPNALLDLAGTGTGSFTVQPVTSHDPTNVEFMVESDFGARNAVKLWRVTNPLGTTPTITVTPSGVGAWEKPPAQKQKNNTLELDGNDGRIGNAVLRNGTIWAAHGVGVAGRGAVRAYQFDASGNGAFIKAYEVKDAALNLHYPSIDVDQFGGVLLGYSSAAATIFPSISFSTKGPEDADFSAPAFMIEGKSDYTPKSNQNRWGDYSDTAIDPADPTIVWHQNELAQTTNTWKLAVGAVKTTAQSFEITAPNGGEVLRPGSVVPITWESSGFETPGNVKIQVSRDGGRSFSEVIVDSTPDDGTYDWTVTGPLSDSVRVKVTSLEEDSVTDASDANFSIVDGSLTVLTPNGGESVVVGSKLQIAWGTTGFASTIAKVLIELSRDGGETWDTLFRSAPNSGSAEWTVEGAFTTEARIRVSPAGAESFADESNGDFEIRAVSELDLTSPDGGERLVVGGEATITWTSAGFKGGVKIELSTNGGATWATLFPNTPNDGTEEWRVSADETKLARLRISSVTEPDVVDTSDGLFTIETVKLVVTAPTSKTVALIGIAQTIRWKTRGLPGSSEVSIEISRDGGDHWETIKDRTENDGEALWTVRGPSAKAALIRVTSLVRKSASAFSASFPIVRPTLRLVDPNGGEVWPRAHQRSITWKGSTLGLGTVRIELSRDGGRSWKVIVKKTSNDGGASWGVHGRSTSRARIRIIWSELNDVRDQSDADFTIKDTN